MHFLHFIGNFLKVTESLECYLFLVLSSARHSFIIPPSTLLITLR